MLGLLESVGVPSTSRPSGLGPRLPARVRGRGRGPFHGREVEKRVDPGPTSDDDGPRDPREPGTYGGSLLTP